ncbi:uncharacterized protein LOC114277029 isoform X1 [Camellia sinensis]|uniref:uncharacterized protein LOC114277029 isoform X1 n=1 Tax=Camellia sinensis TaxID=4442 RepID=UPI00103681E6|nr:uncharacterized protein LOC114277029 isoform X1 [Camellia sinensis]
MEILKLCCRLWYPSSLTFMQSLCSGNDSSILAVTEGCQLSIWDLRMKENGGCVRRIYGSVGDIFYAVYSSSTSIAVGGADRTVTVYDPRRYLDHNQFTGRIPDAFYKHTFLKEMYIEGNAFRPGVNPIGVHNVLEVSDTEFLF